MASEETADAVMDGGIMVTASHNSVDYNGLKLVREEARQIGADTGLKEIEALVKSDDMVLADAIIGERKTLDTWDAYIEHLDSYIDVNELKPLKVVINPGIGTRECRTSQGLPVAGPLRCAR